MQSIIKWRVDVNQDGPSLIIVSLFNMYIDMGERIAGKQDRPSVIIEDPLRAP